MVRDEMRKTKSQPLYEGPFTIVRRKASGNYLLRGIDGSEYVRPPNVLKVVAPEILDGLNVNDTIYAAVDKILEHRIIDGKMRYLVHWKNESKSNDSWLAHDDFVDYGPIQQYEKSLKGSKRTKKVVHAPLADPEAKEVVAPTISKETVPEANATTEAEVTQQCTSRDFDKLVEQGSTAEQPVGVTLDLDKNQLGTVGPYWLTMQPTRKRSKPIVESDEDN